MIWSKDVKTRQFLIYLFLRVLVLEWKVDGLLALLLHDPCLFPRPLKTIKLCSKFLSAASSGNCWCPWEKWWPPTPGFSFSLSSLGSIIFHFLFNHLIQRGVLHAAFLAVISGRVCPNGLISYYQKPIFFMYMKKPWSLGDWDCKTQSQRLPSFFLF